MGNDEKHLFERNDNTRNLIQILKRNSIPWYILILFKSIMKIPERAKEWEAPAEIETMITSSKKASKQGVEWLPWSPRPNLPPSPTPHVYSAWIEVSIFEWIFVLLSFHFKITYKCQAWERWHHPNKRKRINKLLVLINKRVCEGVIGVVRVLFPFKIFVWSWALAWRETMEQKPVPRSCRLKNSESPSNN